MVPKQQVTQSPLISEREAAICGRVREVRKDLGVPLAVAAMRCGCSVPALKSYEYAKVSIKYGFAKRFCKEFNINMRWLATGEGPTTFFIPVASEQDAHIPEDLLFSEVYSKILADFIDESFKKLEAWVQSERMADASSFLHRARMGFGAGWKTVREFKMECLSRDISALIDQLSPDAFTAFISEIEAVLDSSEEKYKADIKAWKTSGERKRLDAERAWFNRYVEFKLGRALRAPSELSPEETIMIRLGGTANNALTKNTERRISAGHHEYPGTTQMQNNPIPQRLIAARKKASLTQAAAAQAWGISIGTLRDWEQGRRKPSGLYAQKIESILSAIETEAAEELTSNS